MPNCQHTDFAAIQRMLNNANYAGAAQYISDLEFAFNAVRPLKIALTGKARSGKDTVATILAMDYGMQTVAFADRLKQIGHLLRPDLFAPDKPKPRRWLQEFGEHVCAYDPQSFIRPVIAQAAQTKRIVVTDVRKQPEYDALAAAGFTFIRVNATDRKRLARAHNAGDVFDAQDMAHATEQAVDSFAVDYELTNNGSLADLERQVEAVMAEIITKGSD